MNERLLALRNLLLLLIFLLVGLACSSFLSFLTADLSSARFLLLSALSSLLCLFFPAEAYALTLQKIEGGNSRDWSSRLYLRKPQWRSRKETLLWVLVTLVVFASAFMIEEVSQWVVAHLPGDFGEQIRNYTQSMESRQQMMLRGNAWTLCQQIVCVAFVPALSEELFMRGALQPIVIKILGKRHLGIFLTALLFSFLHLSIVHFFGILLFGLYFGYMTERFKSIYPSICVHFLNNTLTLIVFYIYQ